MLQTDLLKALLEKANTVKEEQKSGQLYASHMGAAVTELCRSKYMGLALSDQTYHPCRFEEERLRYLFGKTTRVANYFKIHSSVNAKQGVEEPPFDISACETVAKSRGAEILSADVVFLCALTQLHQSYRGVAPKVTTEEDVISLLRDADENIYDYVIEQVGAVCAELTKKANEAKTLRDWKPADKFADPEALEKAFFAKIQVAVENDVMTVKIPKFFGATDLKLSIHRNGDFYYVHDNGCALRHLKKQVSDEKKRQRMVKKVCHSCWLEKDRITDSFLNAEAFLLYLQKLVFVAQADLYYTKAEKPLAEADKDYRYAETAEHLKQEELLTLLKSCIHFDYDENAGLSYWLSMRYPIASVRCSCLMETLEKGGIRISDARKGKTEGEIFEAFYWDHEEIAPYGRFVSKVAMRFGAEFDGKDVFLTDKAVRFPSAILRFFNLATLLSELGRGVAL